MPATPVLRTTARPYIRGQWQGICADICVSAAMAGYERMGIRDIGASPTIDSPHLFFLLHSQVEEAVLNIQPKNVELLRCSSPQHRGRISLKIRS